MLTRIRATFPFHPPRRRHLRFLCSGLCLINHLSTIFELRQDRSECIMPGVMVQLYSFRPFSFDNSLEYASHHLMNLNILPVLLLLAVEFLRFLIYLLKRKHSGPLITPGLTLMTLPNSTIQ